MATTSLTNSLKTPGVYLEEIPGLPPSITQVETAIPAFIGYTQTAADSRAQPLVQVPYLITSILDYQTYFGVAAPEQQAIVVSITPGANNSTNVNAAIDATKRSKFRMYYALQLFFANGGGQCYIVSAGTYDKTSGVILKDDLKAGVDASEKVREITLYVFPDAQGLTSAVDYYDVYTYAIQSCVKLQNRFTVTDVFQDPAAGRWLDNITTLRNTLSGDTDFLKYAASYFPNLETTIEFDYGADTNVQVTGVAGASTLADLKTLNNALYYQAISAIQDIPNDMPPSPAMVGIYARVDAARGVWKAPANEAVIGVSAPAVLLTNQDQDDLNVDVAAGKSINAIRFFTGRGILVWGARTLAGNDNEWRYVPVRRFFIMVEESTKLATAQFVFEPNDIHTWTRVRSMIENFLTLQWKAGALQGTTTAEAFYVRVGLGQTMTELDLWEGRMIVEIGLAPVRPAEFIILQFTQKMLTAS